MAKKIAKNGPESLSRIVCVGGEPWIVMVPSGPRAAVELDLACRDTAQRLRHEQIGAAVAKGGRRNAITDDTIRRIGEELQKRRRMTAYGKESQTQTYERVATICGVSPNTVKKYDEKLQSKKGSCTTPP